VNAARKIARNISLGGSEWLVLEGDVFVEGEGESFRLGLIVSGNAAIQHGSLKVFRKSRHPPTYESIKEPKERRDLVLVILQTSDCLLRRLEIAYPAKYRPTTLSRTDSSASHLTRVVAENIMAATIDGVVEEVD
jgi:hypothetical protein